MTADAPRFVPHPGAATDSPRIKRFYATVAIEQRQTKWCVVLDGKGVKTPSRRDLQLPTPELAEAVAAEWRAQGDFVEPTSMPLTRLVNSAIDGVAGREAEVVADIVAFACNDLVCYLADTPRELTLRQSEGWGPIHTWAKSELGIRLRLATGVMPIAQETAVGQRVAEVLAAHGAMGLAGVHSMTTLTGSALLAIAVAKGRLAVDEAWLLAHIDEDYQIERWGEDAEAARWRAIRRSEMEAAARLATAPHGN